MRFLIPASIYDSSIAQNALIFFNLDKLGWPVHRAKAVPPDVLL